MPKWLDRVADKAGPIAILMALAIAVRAVIWFVFYLRDVAEAKRYAAWKKDIDAAIEEQRREKSS